MTTLDELLRVRGLLNLMSDEFQKIPNSLNENTADNRVELLFSCYCKLSNHPSKNYASFRSIWNIKSKKWEAQPLTHLMQRHEPTKYAMHRGFLFEA
jgi:hypothetical protein